jgi:hypothetical protein
MSLPILSQLSFLTLAPRFASSKFFYMTTTACMMNNVVIAHGFMIAMSGQWETIFNSNLLFVFYLN